jgi:hypothetical protein
VHLRCARSLSQLAPPRASSAVDDAGTLREDRVLLHFNNREKARANAWPIFGGEAVTNANGDKMPRHPENGDNVETKKPAGCDTGRLWLAIEALRPRLPHGLKKSYGQK